MFILKKYKYFLIYVFIHILIFNIYIFNVFLHILIFNICTFTYMYFYIYVFLHILVFNIKFHPAQWELTYDPFFLRLVDWDDLYCWENSDR